MDVYVRTASGGLNCLKLYSVKHTNCKIRNPNLLNVIYNLSANPIPLDRI
jgi:hypothetical protein